MAEEGYEPLILDTKPSGHRGGAPGGRSAQCPNLCSGWCKARGSKQRPGRASPRGRRPQRSCVPRTPENDRAPLDLPVVATAAAAAIAVAAAAAALGGGRWQPGSASLPAPGQPGQQPRRLFLRLLPDPPRLMPGPGRRSPGATCTSHWACPQMARRGRALGQPTMRRAPTTREAGPAPESPRPLRVPTALPPALRRALYSRPRAARISGSAVSRGPEPQKVPSARVRSPTCVCGAARSGPGPAANDRPAPPARALRPRRGSCRSPWSRAQTRVPSPPGRAGELCRAAAVAAAAHYHRPARAAAVLKRQRPTRRKRWAPPSALSALMLSVIRFPPLVAFFFPTHQTCSWPVLDPYYS